jgi:hypothetical protein
MRRWLNPHGSDLPPLDGFTDRDQDGPFVLLLGHVEITRQSSRIVA